LRKTPIKIILEQVLKLYRQVEAILNSGNIHGDIRETNVMIAPNDGKMTLIDFGWLMPIDEFFEQYDHALGFYSNPPESILNHNNLLCIMLHPDTRKNIPLTNIADSEFTVKLQTYSSKNIYAHQNKDAYIESINDNANYVNQQLDDAVNSYVDCESDDTVKNKLNEIMTPFFDCYGLSLTMYVLFSKLYSPEARSRLTNGDIPYTEEEMSRINEVLDRIMNDIIIPCLSFTIEERINIHEARARLESILSGFSL
jgi:serine/threonine protein kinase